MTRAKAKARVLSGGAKLRLRQAARNDWSADKEGKFLEVLAQSCNVTIAGAAAGVSSTALYRRKKIDASFRRAWAEAIAVGFAELEMMLLRRALHGVERTIKGPDGEPAIMTEYNDRTALALLKQHRDSAVEAETEISSEAHDEACERIMAKLQRLRERKTGVAGAEAGAVSVKGCGDRLAVIAEALKWARGKTQ